jgi:hypothetical protein
MTPVLITSKITATKNEISSTTIRFEASGRKYRALVAKKAQGEHNSLDRESRIATVLAGEDVKIDNDIDAQIKADYLIWESLNETLEFLKKKLATVTREAALDYLQTPEIQKRHGDSIKKGIAGLLQASEANAEISQLGLELRDRGIPFYYGICQLSMEPVLGFPNQHSATADFMRAAVKAGYLKAQDLPKMFRAS